MKKITFKQTERKPNEQGVELAREEIVKFLSSRGVLDMSAKEYVKVSHRIITLRPDCCNKDYTQAFALLFLFLAESNAVYITHNSGHFAMIEPLEQASWLDVVDYFQYNTIEID
jgi:hypothetical protein